MNRPPPMPTVLLRLDAYLDNEDASNFDRAGEWGRIVYLTIGPEGHLAPWRVGLLYPDGKVVEHLLDDVYVYDQDFPPSRTPENWPGMPPKRDKMIAVDVATLRGDDTP